MQKSSLFLNKRLILKKLTLKKMTNQYDYIIVGAGVAGCVVAARLSENPQTSVLLVESGKDISPGSEPSDILDSYPTSYYNRSYMWPALKVAWRQKELGLTGFPQGKIMGGGGSLMGMVSFRGVPNDYADWQKTGIEGWGWDDVLPFYRLLENDWDFDGSSHGKAGPIPLRRIPVDQWPPLTRMVSEYAKENNIPFIEDMNADFRDGFGRTPIASTQTRRASTALNYLTADVRARKNLTLTHESHVQKIIFENTKAIGVEVQTKDGLVKFYGQEIIMSCGGLFTPAVLLRSGIGNEQQLNAFGIPIVAHRPGVGQNLQNHITLFQGFHLKKKGRQSSELRTHPTANLRYSSGMPGGSPQDLYINILSKTSWSDLGQQIGNLAPCLLRPRSTGHVSLVSADPKDYPEIEFNFLKDPADLPRITAAFIKSVEILAYPGVRDLMGKPFPVRFSDRLRELNEFNSKNIKLSARLATLLDVLPWLSDFVLANLTGDAVNLFELIKDPERLSEHILKNVAGMFHPVGSCRMGSPDDIMAVTDAQGSVYGVSGLRIIDASIMPNLMAGNTNIPTIMVAEKISAAILEGKH